MSKNEQSQNQPLHISHHQHFLSKPCRKIVFLDHPSKKCSPNLNGCTTNDTDQQTEKTRPLQAFLRSRTRGLENIASQNSPATQIQSPLEDQPKNNLTQSSHKISAFLDSPQQQSPSTFQTLHTTTATPQNSLKSQKSLIFHLKSQKAISARAAIEENSTHIDSNKPAENNYFQPNDSENHQKVTSYQNLITSIASFPLKLQQQQQQQSGFANVNQGINSLNSKSCNSLIPESPILNNIKKEQYPQGCRSPIDPTQFHQDSQRQPQNLLDQNKPFSDKSKKKTNQLISIFPIYTNNPMKPKLFQNSSRSFETSNYSTGLFVKTQLSQKSNLHNISGILSHGSPILKNQMSNSPMKQQTSISLRLIPSSKLIMPQNNTVSQSQIVKTENNISHKQQRTPLNSENNNNNPAGTSTIFKDLLRKQNKNIFQPHSSKNKWNHAKTVDTSRGTSIEKTNHFIDEIGQSYSQSSRNNSNRLCSSKLILHQATQNIEPSLFNEETNKQIELFLQRMKEMLVEYENPKRVSQVIYKIINNIPYLVKMLFTEEDSKQRLILKDKVNLQTIQYFMSQRENIKICLEQNPLNPMMLVIQRPEGKQEAAEQRLCGDLSFLEQKISILNQKHFKEKCDQLTNALIDESLHIQTLERSIEQQINFVQNKNSNCQVEHTSSGLITKHNYRGVDGYRFLKKKSFPEGTNRTHSYFKGEFGRLGEFQNIDKQTIGVTHEIDNLLERIKDLAPSVPSKITSANTKKKLKIEKNISNSHRNNEEIEVFDQDLKQVEQSN